MEIALNFPFVCIILSMASGVVCLKLSGKAAYHLNLAVAFGSFVLNGILLFYMQQEPQAITFLMGHFTAPWGNEIRFGPFEVLLATVFSLVMLLTSLTGRDKVLETTHPDKVNMYFLMMNMLLSSTLALVYTNDLFTAYVFVEINTLCACGFVAARNTGKAIAATIKYLIMSLLGSGLFLMSIIILYVLTGQILMPNVRENIDILIANGSYTMPITIIVGLLAVSMAIKSALFPFHNWVPTAYDRAFNLSNGLSSGLVLKSYIVLLIKIFYRVFGLENIMALKILNILFFFGILSMLLASLEAVRENNVKKMLSYSSIAQIGYIYVGISMGTNEGFAAATFTMIAHCLIKPLLFASCEGLMSVANNSKQAEDFRGTAYLNPVAGIAFGVGTFSMIGFPLFPGFYGKYLLAVAAAGIPSKLWIVLSALALSTLLNAMYFLRILQLIYTRPKEDDKSDKKVKSAKKVKSEKSAKEQDNSFVGPVISPKYNAYMILFILVNISLGFLSSFVTRLILSGLEYL